MSQIERWAAREVWREEDKNRGDFVLYYDHARLLEERDTRIKELEEESAAWESEARRACDSEAHFAVVIVPKLKARLAAADRVASTASVALRCDQGMACECHRDLAFALAAYRQGDGE